MLPSSPDRHAAPIDLTILDEAAEWMVLLQAGDISNVEQQAFDAWRQRSPQHAQAWLRAQSIMAAFGDVSSSIGHESVRRLQKTTRRDTLQLLGVAMIAAPTALVAWRELPWREWSADMRTAAGEQRRIELADGTQLVLNTVSAADVTMTATERRVRLHAGEVLITTGKDPSPTYRPFIVQTAHGTVRALGTRFSVRRFADDTEVSVFESAVEIRIGTGEIMRLTAGESARFSAGTTQPVQAIDATAAAWEQGMLVARSMRLGDLVDELGRYHSGILRCHPDVAELPVSGAFSLRNIDASLALLQKTLPVQVKARTRYWLTVEPRSSARPAKK